MNKKIKIIIDTDPGDDIDDVLAIAYALKSNLFEIIGVTTSFKDTNKRARIIKKMFKLANVPHIPVYAGYGEPLIRDIPESQEINQYTSDLDSDEYKPDGDKEDAIEFIMNALKFYPNDLIIVGMAPLCNLSRVILKDKYVLNLAKKVSIMGGDFASSNREWNLYCDVDSAKLVFENVPSLQAFGYDITYLTHLSKEDTKIVEKCDKNEFYSYVGQLVRMWRKTHDNHVPCLHDVIPLMRLVDDSICDLKEDIVSVDTDNNPGSLIRNLVVGNKIQYGCNFNQDKFMKNFMEIFK